MTRVIVSIDETEWNSDQS